MKKLFALLLAAVMCLSFAACGSAATNDESSTEQQQESSTEQQQESNESEQQEESTEQESSETEEVKYLTAFDGKSPKIPTDSVKNYLSTFSITNENWKDYLELVHEEEYGTWSLFPNRILDDYFCYEIVSANVECKVVKEGASKNGQTITITDNYLTLVEYPENVEFTIDDFEFKNVQIELIVADFPEELWATNKEGETIVYTGKSHNEQIINNGKAYQISLKEFLE